MGGHKAFALAEHERLVRQLYEAQPDITLDEMRARSLAAGVTGAASDLLALDAETLATGISASEHGDFRT
jgi:ABC-type Fe2+-enterobactin transport system substrate-binding protein